MPAEGLCFSCRPVELFGYFPDAPPPHCYGRGDRPAPEGVMGGFRCSCSCRDAEVKCRCVWYGVPCDKAATQEDGLCDWCGVRRPEDMRGNPFAMWSAEGEYLGLAGGTITGYNHQAGWSGILDSVRPTACWMASGDAGAAPETPDSDLGAPEEAPTE